MKRGPDPPQVSTGRASGLPAIFLLIAAASLLVVAAAGGPDFVAAHLSSDGSLTPVGIQQVTVFRLTLAALGVITLLAGLTTLLVPAGRMQRFLTWVEHRQLRLGVTALIVWWCLFAIGSVGRTRRLSPDSMNYIDVARHIAQGHGVVQSTLGFNQHIVDPAAPIPSPLTVQPPLYPLMIAALSRFGIPFVDGALLLAALGLAAVILLLAAFAWRLDGAAGAAVAVALALVYQPLTAVAGYAWTETMALGWAMGALWVGAGVRRRPRGAVVAAGAAGLMAGLALATRFGMAPVAPLCVGALLLPPGVWRTRLLRAGAFATGCAAIALPLLARLDRLSEDSGTTVMGSPHPGVFGELSAAVVTLCGRYLGLHPLVELPVLALALLLLLWQLRRRKELGTALRSVVATPAHVLILAWGVVSVVFVLVMQQRVYLESISPRYMLPMGFALIVTGAALITRAWPRMRRRWGSLVIAVLLFRIVGEMVLLATGATFRPVDAVAASERLTWVARNTSEDDLIIGDDTMDIPFWLGRSASVSFSPAPAPFPTLPLLQEIVRAHGKDKHRCFIVLRAVCHTEEEWRATYGAFVADLVAGRVAGATLVARLADGQVFEFRP